MNDLQCLSMMELLDLRDGVADLDGAEHVATCLRCAALQRELPELPDHPVWQVEPLRYAERPILQPGAKEPGQLWRAVCDHNPDRAWVVVLVGRIDTDRFAAVPAFPKPQFATKRDVILERDVLGYPAFLDVFNTVEVPNEELQECNGKLGESVLAALRKSLHEPDDVADPRHQLALDRREHLVQLWKPVVFESPAEESFGQTLSNALDGHEWDRSTLLESSGISGGNLANFAADQLDLTDRRDVPALAAVIHTLEIPWDKARALVKTSLQRSSGGHREGSGPSLPMAARSRPGVSREEVEASLFGDQSQVDDSASARNKAIAAYLADLESELDDLA